VARGAQVVSKNAVWVHSQSAPRTALSIGFGRASNSATPAKATTATAIASAFGLSLEIIMPVLRLVPGGR
jgi:hypothetical protein